MKHLFIAAALALVSLPTLASEAKTFAFGEPAPASKATRTVEVVLKDIAFEPTSLEVKAGETVRFVLINQGKLPHEFNLGDKAMHAEQPLPARSLVGSASGGGKTGARAGSIAWHFQKLEERGILIKRNSRHFYVGQTDAPTDQP